MTTPKEGSETPAAADDASQPEADSSTAHLSMDDALKEAKARWDRNWGPRYANPRPWPYAALPEMYHQLEQVPVWEAVVLSLGYDPWCFNTGSVEKVFALPEGKFFMRASSGNDAIYLMDPVENVAFDRATAMALFGRKHGVDSIHGRLKIAVSRWGAERGLMARVELNEFSAWAHTKGWKMPKEWSRNVPLPDWSKWGAFSQVPLAAAVALSCNMAPERIVGGRGGLPTFGPPEFLKLLEIAKNHADSGELPIAREDHNGERFVRLEDFAAWADGRREWSLPSEFPRPRTGSVRERNSVAGDDKPLGAKERTNLLVIIAALAEKAGVETAHPTTAAKEIVKITRRLKANISVGTVEKYLKETEAALDRKAIPEEDDE